MSELEFLKQQAQTLQKMYADTQARINDLQSTPAPSAPSRKYSVILDFGHGGFTPEGENATPDKQFYHPNQNFHKSGWFFEGVFNRVLGEKIRQKCQNNGFKTFVISNAWKDTPLHTRIYRANQIAQTHKSVLISVHGNASPMHTASGWSVFVARGASQTSRKLANYTAKEIVKLLPETFLRVERPHVNYWERDFMMVAETSMPAILTENLFFDYLPDALQMHSPATQNQLAEAHVCALLKLENE